MEKQTLLDKLESFNEQLNITHYWIILLKYKRIILLLPIFFGLLGYFVALNIKPVFQSNATLVIEADVKKIVDIEEVYGAKGPGGFGRNFNHVNNQIQIIQSDEIFNGVLSNEEITKKIAYLHNTIPDQFITRNIKAIKKLVFYRFKDFEDKENIPKKEKLKQYIKSNFKVSNIRQSDVVVLSFISHNPELAKFVLTELIESYLRYDVDTKIKVTNYANQQINLRLSELLINMEKAEQNLLNYKKVNKLIDIGDIKVLKTDQIKSVSKRIIDANRELQKKENDLTAIKLAEGNVDELLAIADLRNKKEVDAIRTNINATGNNIEALQIIYKDEHPKLKKMFKTKENLDNRLSEILDENIYQLKSKKLEKALKKIEANDKMILLMRYQDDFSIKEIQEVLDLGSSAVKMRLNRAKGRLIEIYNTL